MASIGLTESAPTELALPRGKVGNVWSRMQHALTRIHPHTWQLQRVVLGRLLHEQAEQVKCYKYSAQESKFFFVPIAIETSGVFGPSAYTFHNNNNNNNNKGFTAHAASDRTRCLLWSLKSTGNITQPLERSGLDYSIEWEITSVRSFLH